VFLGVLEIESATCSAPGEEMSFITVGPYYEAKADVFAGIRQTMTLKGLAGCPKVMIGPKPEPACTCPTRYDQDEK
jgi:hypothetical protein